MRLADPAPTVQLTDNNALRRCSRAQLPELSLHALGLSHTRTPVGCTQLADCERGAGSVENQAPGNSSSKPPTLLEALKHLHTTGIADDVGKDSAEHSPVAARTSEHGGNTRRS